MHSAHNQNVSVRVAHVNWVKVIRNSMLHWHAKTLDVYTTCAIIVVAQKKGGRISNSVLTGPIIVACQWNTVMGEKTNEKSLVFICP